ncbi:MAG: chorismate synthase [Oscillospiraceae bacterium]|nr:chorismate synthase [Oscillospiraceae bacterium]
MRYVLFGESHGPAIGVVLEEVPAGLSLNMEFVASEMARRAPGKSALSTSRREADQVQVLSGVFQGKTTGTPLCAVILNTDVRSGDYAAPSHMPRPGHADYTGRIRYGGFADYRGGGHFSGRLTAPLVFAGAVAKLILMERGVFVGAGIQEIAGIRDELPKEDLWNPELFLEISKREFPVFSPAQGEKMQAAILAARTAGDSVGGIISCAIFGLPGGLGGPDLERTAEGEIARQVFAVPAVKGIAFGAGFDFARMRGSEANDPLCLNEVGSVRTKTNHSGGINGGITNGMPLTFSVAMRPTPSIALPQQTVDLDTEKEAVLSIKGRHDPCIVHRAVPVIESAAALAALSLMGI